MNARGKKLRPSKEQPSKSFLPRFFTKKRAGSRGRAPGRATQRAENPIAKEAQEGVKGEPSPGVPPLRAARPPAASRTAITRAVNKRCPDVSLRNSPIRLRNIFTFRCLFHPISLVLPKETGWSPKEKRLGWWRPREVSGPTRLSHSRGRCHSAAKVSAARTYFITRPRGEGFGLAEVWPSKSFMPRSFVKSGA